MNDSLLLDESTMKHERSTQSAANNMRVAVLNKNAKKMSESAYTNVNTSQMKPTPTNSNKVLLNRYNGK